MQSSLSESQFLFLDCQTTGASPRLGSLLEVAFCRGNLERIIARESFLIEQVDKREIPERIKELTGITDDDLLNAVAPQVLCERILLELDEQNNVRGCIVHYAKFEKQFLNHVLAACTGLESLPTTVVCTHEIAKRLYPEMPSKGIRALHGFFGGSAINFKRASCHAEATHLIWSKMVADLLKIGIADFTQLLDWLEAPPPRVGQSSSIQKHHVDSALRLALPDLPGVYRMVNRRGDVLYVGKATSLKSRVNSYFRGQTKKDLKTREMLLQTWNVQITECSTALDAAIFESDEIKRLEPPYNISLKKGRRQILFYSRKFDSFKTDRDNVHCLGPFVGHRMLEPLYLLCQGASSGRFDPRIFLDMVTPEDIAAGFAIFSRRFNLDATHPLTVRNMLALGARIARREKLSVNLSDEREVETAVTITADEAEALPTAESALLEEADPTPEDFADAIEKLLRRAAVTHSRAKALQLLSDAEIAYFEKKQMYILNVSGGEIGKSVSASSLKQVATAPERRDTPWTLEKYDRLRVLMSELVRMRNRGAKLSTIPELRFFLR